MADFSDVSDKECVRRYYEERDEKAFEAFFERAGPLVLARLRRFVQSKGASLRSGTSGIEPEDALQYAMARLIERRYSLDGPASVQGWLVTVGKNYLITPWRPRRLAVHIFELWPGSGHDHDAHADVDWLAQHLAEGLHSTVGEFVLDPEEHLLRGLEDADRVRQLDEFRQERDRWLEAHPAYLPVVELIGVGVKREGMGLGLGMAAVDTLLSVLCAEEILPAGLSPDRIDGIRTYFRPERAGEILYDITLKCLKRSMGQESRSGRSLKAKHINGWQGREDQRHDTPLVDCLAKLPPGRQRALRLADHGFTGAEIGVLDGRSERAGQLLLNRARKQLEEIQRAGPASWLRSNESEEGEDAP